VNQGQRVRTPRREVHGVLLLDKPIGFTSNDALQKAKGIFAAAKAGHTGSLDPLATGMLPICFGEATKVSGFLLDADKRYAVTAKLGERTATADAEGEVVESKPVPVLSASVIEQTLATLRGDILQVPPMYSALRHQGQRLYDLAREGIEVERPARPVTIHEMVLTAWTPDSLSLEVHCSKGTYIRTLMEDIAQAMGTLAHVTVLRRLSVGPFATDSKLYTLADLEACKPEGPGALDALLLPVDYAVLDWPKADLTADGAWYFSRGQAVFVPAGPTSGRVRVYGEGRFLGVGEMLDDGRLTPKRLMNLPQTAATDAVWP
jgi:tRNA pseudouridine55 synthase